MVFGSLYFFFIRPASQKQKAARPETRKVELGERAQTIGGFVGTVVKMDDGLITLRGASGVELDFIPTAIARKYNPPAAVPERPTTNTKKKATRSNGPAGRLTTIDDRQSHPHDRHRVRRLGGDPVTGMGTETRPGPGRWSLGRLHAGHARHQRRHGKKSSRSWATASTASVVSGATVNLQGKNVVVSVPGATDARHVLPIVGETAQLLFRPVLCQVAEPTEKAKTYTGSVPDVRQQVPLDRSQPGGHAEQLAARIWQ